MEFLSFNPVTEKLTLEHGEIPKLKNNDVLIRVAYSGICGTDLHILDGSFPAKKDGTLILGHEFSGTVEDIGDEVTEFKVGQKVVIDPNSGCNKCTSCHGGCYHFCTKGGINNTIGIFKNGGWATHAVVPETQVHHVPDDMEMHHAALAEPMACIAHGWDIMNPIHVGSQILVIGAGIIGLLWACILHLHGLRKTVTISEINAGRRAAVQKLDLDYSVCNPTELRGNFDVAVDCSGSAPAMESALARLKHGGRLCIFGVANPAATVSINPFQMYLKELTIAGVIIDPFTFPKGLALVQAMAARYFNYEKLGIKVYKLSEYKEALEALRTGKVSKAMFKCS
ncbi:D-altritol 5-dehydrogenase-like [Chelonus insularis]|uniref:D-altritol 5-dehydrogenase-like n=1 Tax=Chelonus insularis TaxID=460826 RepID=UPI00158F0421|nr:D-altritol 5-dehydrogenase-like [Chelonus insularis]